MSSLLSQSARLAIFSKELAKQRGIASVIATGCVRALCMVASKKKKDGHDSIQDFLGYVTEQAKASGGNRRYVASGLNGWNVWNTTDQETRELVAKNFPEIKKSFALEAPTTPSASSSKTKTHIISDNDVQSQYPDFRREIPHVSVSSGGISALFAAYLLSALHKDGLLVGKKPPVLVMSPEFKSSATIGSSGQYHTSHAMPMYTDPEFGTLNIMLQTIKRILLSIDPKVDNYMIAEIASINPKIARVGLDYLGNEIQYKFRKKLGLSTICDETIHDAIVSGTVMDKIGKELGKNILDRKGTIRVAYNTAETLEMEETKAEMARHGIVCKEINAEQALEKSGTKPKTGVGGSIWEVESDGSISPDLFDRLCKAFEANGGVLIKHGTISAILHDLESKRATGVVVDLGNQDGVPQRRILRADSVYTSFGHAAEYTADNGIKLDKPVEDIIAATGFSAHLLVKGKHAITRPIDSNNSHFTPVAHAQAGEHTYTIVKTTSGAAIGRDSFCIDHAANNLWYAVNVIFPDMEEVSIICAKSCSRPINGRNSGIITQVLPDDYVATGFGGKGITDGAAYAAKYVKTVLKGDKVAERTFEERYLKETKVIGK